MFEKTKNKRKRCRGWPIFLKKVTISAHQIVKTRSFDTLNSLISFWKDHLPTKVVNKIPNVFMGRFRPFILVFSIQLTENNVQYKFCRWLDSNRGPLVLEETALSTGPKPLPISNVVRLYMLAFAILYTLVQFSAVS